MAEAHRPLHGHSGCQPLMRACIGQGLRADLERLDAEPVSRLLAALRAEGVPRGNAGESGRGPDDRLNRRPPQRCAKYRRRYSSKPMSSAASIR